VRGCRVVGDGVGRGGTIGGGGGPIVGDTMDACAVDAELGAARSAAGRAANAELGAAGSAVGPEAATGLTGRLGAVGGISASFSSRWVGVMVMLFCIREISNGFRDSTKCWWRYDPAHWETEWDGDQLWFALFAWEHHR
jgi:hypothetical protein